MGTETASILHNFFKHNTPQVKLNNPLMGTETLYQHRACKLAHYPIVLN